MAVVARQREQVRQQDLWDKFWKDKTGRIVVWQRPNVWLIAWVVLTLVSLFLNGVVSNIIWYVALADLALWAVLEMWKGVNYLRRLLGLIVLVLVIMAVFKVGY